MNVILCLVIISLLKILCDEFYLYHYCKATLQNRDSKDTIVRASRKVFTY